MPGIAWAGVMPFTEVPYDPVKDEVDSLLTGPAAVPPPVPVPPPPPIGGVGGPPVAPVVEAAIENIAPTIHPLDCDSILDLDSWYVVFHAPMIVLQNTDGEGRKRGWTGGIGGVLHSMEGMMLSPQRNPSNNPEIDGTC
jgi:hypothetical protein